MRINSLLAATPIFLIGAVPYIAFLFHRRRTVRKMVDGLPTIQVARSPEEQAAVSSLRYWSGLAPTLLGLAMAWVWLAAWHNDAGHLWIAVACAALVLILDTVRRSRLLAPIRNWNPFDYPKPPQV